MHRKDIDWKTYESITKYIYKTLGKEFGVKIKCYGNTCKVKGKSGVEHQIDVLTSHSNGIHEYLTAIECKYWNKKINKDIVMKIANTIEDSGINKGVIVCKKGFTTDGFNYAKYKNIDLVELREIEKKDLSENSKEIHILDFDVKINFSLTRTEILNIDIGNNRELKYKDELDLLKYVIIMENKSQDYLFNYITNFRKDVNPENKKIEKLTKHYNIPNGVLYNQQTKKCLKIDGITFTGQLRIIDSNENLKFKLVDKVWLIMKSIFDNRTFTISENGLINEN
ncbi:Restriction endonuclease [Chishuiella changwenlii]|uniref:Restriction endonuclease n=1 Tax=Chishuiella changwenlii TaxID=1434701 RepID=A0A1M7AP87_9FLAO|nr:restriction endonuclease [Chishuiella changwenlii]GGE90895.1 hypothetical protein GCM10010984_05790 [Chishuiella changwenlii]SHL44507.1 Restriction endonuclease [Chishuiella changwenlii]